MFRRSGLLAVVMVVLGALTAAAAYAGAVRFLIDSQPVGLGRDVVLDFNSSKLSSRAETPDSIAFLLPSTWRFDPRAVARECTPSQAAAVRCPTAARVGYGHVVIHMAGYLFPGGQTDAVGYLTPFVGTPVRRGDPASLVVQVDLLGVKPLFDAANHYLETKLQSRYSVTGRVIRLRAGRFGLETRFSQMPGGFTVPPELAARGVSVKMTRFKLQVGAVRRVRRPFVRRVRVPTASGGSSTLIVHDHRLIGLHLLRRGGVCPGDRQWPWEIRVGFPDGMRVLDGSVRCG